MRGQICKPIDKEAFFLLGCSHHGDDGCRQHGIHHVCGCDSAWGSQKLQCPTSLFDIVGLDLRSLAVQKAESESPSSASTFNRVPTSVDLPTLEILLQAERAFLSISVLMGGSESLRERLSEVIGRYIRP
jgi:hypothetical protein